MEEDTHLRPKGITHMGVVSCRYVIAASVTAFAALIILFIIISAFQYLQRHKIIEVNDLAVIYLSVTAASIIITKFGDVLVRGLHYIYSHIDKENTAELTLKIFDQREGKKILFLLYFIVLLLVNICVFNNIALFDTPKLDTVLIQSFATYVAYDRVISNWSSVAEK